MGEYRQTRWTVNKKKRNKNARKGNEIRKKTPRSCRWRRVRREKKSNSNKFTAVPGWGRLEQCRMKQNKKEEQNQTKKIKRTAAKSRGRFSLRWRWIIDRNYPIPAPPLYSVSPILIKKTNFVRFTHTCTVHPVLSSPIFPPQSSPVINILTAILALGRS